jgi:hypothetical protein
MKRISLIILLAALVILIILPVGCIRVNIGDDSGVMLTKEYDFTGFTAIEAGYAFKVDITQSNTYSVTIIINEKIADRLTVTKNGDTLKIDLKGIFFNFHSSPRATITMPDLRSLDLSGAADGKVKGFSSANDFDLHLSGASSLDIDMEAGDFEAELSGASRLSGYFKAASSSTELSGASHITLTGSGGDTRLDFSGASIGNLENYTVGNADVELSGASQVSLDINGTLDADLSGASRLTYGGKPTLGNIDISSGSSFKPR